MKSRVAKPVDLASQPGGPHLSFHEFGTMPPKENRKSSSAKRSSILLENSMLGELLRLWPDVGFQIQIIIDR